MDTTFLDFSDISLAASPVHYQVKDELDQLLCNDEPFQWQDDCDAILDSILSSANLEFLPQELFHESNNLTNELESAKEDFNKVLDEWKLHLGSSAPSPSPEVKKADALPMIASLPSELLKDDNVYSLTDSKTKIPELNYESPVLEAPDLMSLLEQFEAKLDPCDELLHECIASPKCAHESLMENTSFPACSLPSPVVHTPPLVNIQSIFKKDPVITKHKLPITQLPRFSIILKRDPPSWPLLQNHSSEVVMRDHDYCSLSSSPSSSADLPKTAVNGSARKDDVPKPTGSVEAPTTKPESLYSKLPDYYTSIVPPKCNVENLVTGQKGSEGEKIEEKESVYNKLPSYLTMFATTPSLYLEPTPEPCSKLTKTVLPKTKRKLGPNYRDVKYQVRTERALTPSAVAGPIKWPSRRYSKHNQGRNRKSRSRAKRQMSSRSPSHSVSSRSQSRSQSRSSSSSSSSSCSSLSAYSPSPRVSRSRSRSPIEHYGRMSKYKKRCRYSDADVYDRHKRASRSRSQERWRTTDDKHMIEESKKQIEDRRVVHVGNIKMGTTQADLRKRFHIFGPIEDITLHFRKQTRDCFGFITFVYTCDAFEALEHGNDDPARPKYELSLGGRRLFCLENYSDLDSLQNRRRQVLPMPLRKPDTFDFDNMLKAAKEKLQTGQS